MNTSRPDAIFVLTDYRTLIYRQLIAEFAVKNRLPTMSGTREAVETGGLMSYGPNLVELFTRKTARSLGLTIPEPLLLRANALIQ
jgi:ABC-type uncharacterized transport system substrate-binding protein